MTALRGRGAENRESANPMLHPHAVTAQRSIAITESAFSAHPVEAGTTPVPGIAGRADRMAKHDRSPRPEVASRLRIDNKRRNPADRHPQLVCLEG